MKCPSFSPTTVLYSFLNTQHQAILFKGISELVCFLVTLLNPFYKLKYPSFFTHNFTLQLLNAPSPSNTFQRHFRTSSFLNVPPKPILQVEVLIVFTITLVYYFFECSNTMQYFSNDISGAKFLIDLKKSSSSFPNYPYEKK